MSRTAQFSAAYLFLLLPSTLFSALGQPPAQTDASNIGIGGLLHDCTFAGPVKSIRIETIWNESGRRSNHSEETASCTFTWNGSPLKLHFQERGENSQYFVSRYDSQDREIELDMFGDEDRNNPTRHITKWDRSGRMIETQDFDSGGPVGDRTIYHYSSNGDIIKESSYDDAGHLTSEITRAFDSHHHLISAESLGAELAAVSKQIYSYNTRGQKTEEVFLSDTNAERHVFTYRQDGRLSSAETIVQNPPPGASAYGLCSDCGPYPGKTLFYYNRKGLLEEEQTIQPPDRIVKLSRYRYDTHGRRTQEWVYEAHASSKTPPIATLKVNGRSVSFTRTNGLPTAVYTYDAHGNWIKAVITESSSASSRSESPEILRRKIVYY